MRQLFNCTPSPIPPCPALLSCGLRLTAGLSRVWRIGLAFGNWEPSYIQQKQASLDSQEGAGCQGRKGVPSFSLYSVLLSWRGGGSMATGRAWEALGTVLSHKASRPPQLGSTTDPARAGRCWGDVITRCQL